MPSQQQIDEEEIHDRLARSHFKVPVSELKDNFNVVYGSFEIEGGEIIPIQSVLFNGAIENKMIDGIIKKSKESGYAKSFNLKIDDVFSGQA